MSKRVGAQTVKIYSKPRIIAATSIVGPKEGKGPLKDYFDKIISNDLNGKESFEKSESSMLFEAIKQSIEKAGLTQNDINYIFSGDLLNQLTSSNYAARDMDIPFFGLYGACSTFSESLSLSSMIMDGDFANYAIAATSSHFGAAERQFRFPLEFGSQRPPTAQWTVTGAGAVVLGKNGDFPYVTYVTTGKVKDFGIKDGNNMGAAMAPAAADSIKQHFIDTGRNPDYYDIIATGDLGKIGKNITVELLKEYGYDLSKNYIDCGDEIFDNSVQNTGSGGSGCGCSAVTFCGYIYKSFMKKKIKKVLIVSTGALMSPTSSFQGETIPGIAHAVSVEYGG